MDFDGRTNLIKLAAEGLIESHHTESTPVHSSLAANAEDCPHAPLTADNLERIPLAEQLAPGIRMTDQVLETCSSQVQEIFPDNLPPSRSDNDLMDTSNSACVPPELDPRTSTFRPVAPSTGSVFSVAVQPGSPKSIVMSTEFRTSSPAPSRSFRADSPCSEDHPSSRATTPNHSRSTQNINFLAQSSSGTDTASVIYSDAGSMMSETTNSDVRDQEQAIETQRMQERARLGGEVGIGGPMPMPFARLRDRIYDGEAPQRTVSTSATAATSPVHSTDDPFTDTPMAQSPHSVSMAAAGAPPDSEALGRALASTLT